MNRQEIIYKAINVENGIAVLITHHFFPGAAVKLSFLYIVLYDPHANTSFKISVFEKCYRDTPKQILEAMRRLFAIRNIFAHCGLEFTSLVDPALSGVVDPKKLDKPLDFEMLRTEFLEKEKLCLEYLFGLMKNVGLNLELPEERESPTIRSTGRLQRFAFSSPVSKTLGEAAMDYAPHLHHMEEAIKELSAFHSRTAEPAPLPHQYLGTAIDNTAVLLTAPLNSIDGGTRYAIFSDDRNWMSLMGAVHRSFFSSIQIYVEKGLEHLCESRQFEVFNRQDKNQLAILQRVQDAVEAKGIEIQELRKIQKYFHGRRPGFNDYLETVLENSSLNNATKKKWRRFFQALSIVRNKSSHSDVTLSDQERSALRKGSCEVMVAGDGSLALNSRLYAQIANIILTFFEELYPSLPQNGEIQGHPHSKRAPD